MAGGRRAGRVLNSGYQRPRLTVADGYACGRSSRSAATRHCWRNTSPVTVLGGSLAPTCTTEVVIGSECTGILLDRPLPGEILKGLTYSPRPGPRPVRHVSQDGRLLHSLSVQGIYRLAESSATDLEAILAAPPGAPIPLSRPHRHRHQDVPAGTVPLL
jgi:hypothetical protein